MTVKDLFIAICFLGSVYLAIAGGWNYMKGRIQTHQEKLKVEELIARRKPFLGAEEVLKEIERKKTTALIMFAGGFLGVYLVIAYMNRRRRNIHYPKYKTTES